MNSTWLMIALLGSSAALADPGVAVNSHADLQNSGSRYSGNFNLNQAAGDQTQQTNTRAIAIGTNAQVTTVVRQRLDTSASPAVNASARIGGSSFINGNGVLGVNQSAGANNQMANVMRVGISARPQSMDDSALSQQNVALVPNSGATDTPTGSRQVATSDQAFTGSRGVIQVNQSAGVGNRMANTLSIRVAD